MYMSEHVIDNAYFIKKENKIFLIAIIGITVCSNMRFCTTNRPSPPILSYLHSIVHGLYSTCTSCRTNMDLCVISAIYCSYGCFASKS